MNHDYKRRRCHFDKEESVREWIDLQRIDIENNHAPLDILIARDARRALSILPEGVSLTEAAHAYMRNTEKTEVNSLKLKEAVESFLLDKESAGLRPRSISSLRMQVNRLAGDLGNWRLADIDHDILFTRFTKYNLKGTTRKNYRTSFSNLFSWCIRSGYIKSNPVATISIPKRDQTLPGILTVNQTARLLQSAVTHHPELCGYLTIGFFAGIRPAELMRLKWEAVKEDYIHIGPGVAKTRNQRFVSLQPNLAKWLKEYKGKGPICPVAEKAKRERLVEVRNKAELDEVPTDAAQHSYATYHLALHQDAPKIAHELGHTSLNMLYNHYRNLATKHEAALYFGIKPGNLA